MLFKLFPQKLPRKTGVFLVCAYLYLKHLFEDQLLSAYASYGEVFFGLEEQPEAIMAIGSGHRHSMGVYIRGCQQFRLAEIAHKLGILDDNFKFTPEAKITPEYNQYEREVDSKYPATDRMIHHYGEDSIASLSETENRMKNEKFKNTYMIDGYSGIQTHNLAYMCYKKLNPNGELSIEEFQMAYEGNQTDMLASKPSRYMQKQYEILFNMKPKLLMSEKELRGTTATGLNSNLIKFANEGLWVLAHYNKMIEENWDELKEMTGENGQENPFFEEELQLRTLETNEISKIPSDKIRRFKNLINKLPGSEWYAKFPYLLLSICFTQNLFTKELTGNKSGKWAEETKALFDKIFHTNLPRILSQIEVKPTDLRTMAELAALSTVMSVESIVAAHKQGIPANNLFEEIYNRGVIKLRVFDRSFSSQRERYNIINPNTLLKYAEIKEESHSNRERTVYESAHNMMAQLIAPELNEREKQESFVLSVFQSVKEEAGKRGLSINFAIIATAMASLECGWGRETNMETGLPTLYAGANNIFSIKYNTNQYSKKDYEENNDDRRFYIHYTTEFFDGKNPTVHYEAFRRYNTVKESVSDFFSLIERRYLKTMEAAKINADSIDPNSKTQNEIMSAILEEKYATDPKYGEKALSIARSVEKILRKYGQII